MPGGSHAKDSKTTGVAHDHDASASGFEQPSEESRELLDVARLVKVAVVSVADQLRGAATTRAYDRLAGEHGLDGDTAEGFVSRAGDHHVG